MYTYYTVGHLAVCALVIILCYVYKIPSCSATVSHVLCFRADTIKTAILHSIKGLTYIYCIYTQCCDLICTVVFVCFIKAGED